MPVRFATYHPNVRTHQSMYTLGPGRRSGNERAVVVGSGRESVLLKPHPLVLRALLERYESLAAAVGAAAESVEARRELEDVTYTLCVSTGTRDVEAAVAAARTMLEEAFAVTVAPRSESRRPSTTTAA